jgi:predicted secreted protein
MNWVESIVVYVLIWWVVIFAVLPFGIRAPEELVPGQATGAPARPRIWLKAVITTIAAAVIWLAIFFVIRSDWISFRGS